MTREIFCRLSIVNLYTYSYTSIHDDWACRYSLLASWPSILTRRTCSSNAIVKFGHLFLLDLLVAFRKLSFSWSPSGFHGLKGFFRVHLLWPEPTEELRPFLPSDRNSSRLIIPVAPRPSGCPSAACPHLLFKLSAGLTGRFLMTPATSVRSWAITSLFLHTVNAHSSQTSVLWSAFLFLRSDSYASLIVLNWLRA